MGNTEKFVTLERLTQFGLALLQKIKDAFVQKEDGKGLSTNDYTDADKLAVSTLVGDDTGKSAREIAGEEIEALLVPENAQESLDTLQEISAWIQSHPDEAAAMNAKLELGTRNVTSYVAATGEYVDGTTYYIDDTGTTEVDTTDFEDGVTDVSSYYVASVTATQYGTVKDYVENYVAENAASVDDITTATQQDITDAVDEIFGELFPSVVITGTDEVTVNSTTTLTATTVPAGKTVTWSTSDGDIATVADGVVTGVAEGTVTITASYTKGEAPNTETISGTIEITVVSGE